MNADNNTPAPLAGKTLADVIISTLKDALAENIITIDLRKLSGAADFFIVCQADNTVHTQACADRIIVNLKSKNTRPRQFEGMDEGRWILIDYFDVIVHIMLPEVREFYTIEELWSQGSIIREKPDT